MHNMYEKMKMLNKYDNKDNDPMKKDSKSYRIHCDDICTVHCSL